MTTSELIETDVLVIGCGIAGAVSALQLAESGYNIVIATSASELIETNTKYAQGGIVYRGIDDSPEKFAHDITVAGAGISNPAAVKQIAEEGPLYVREILIEKVGVHFDTRERGEFSLVKEGGHSLHRILHTADSSGHEIESSLIRKLQQFANVKFLANHTAIDLLTPSHHSTQKVDSYNPLRCVGAYLLDSENSIVKRCIARNTILATGGLGQIYLRTTNPVGSRGDGLAMAYRAGARVVNCEYVQFHPTTFFKKNAPMFLITEAMRGAGAVLLNSRGEHFMEKYNVEWKDLAPRDIVSRSIHREMELTGSENVYLDIGSAKPKTEILHEFPFLYQQCRLHGIDITLDLIPVVPAAHYFCGGVWVDINGRTTVNNLYAVGEVSCTGVHGANRLASTSLLEGLVWGAKAASDIISKQRTMLFDQGRISAWNESSNILADPALISQDMTVIRHIMWNYVGLIRTTHRLQRAIRELRNLEIEVERFYRTVRINDELIGLRNAVRAANIITMAAWENNTSLGCHFRES